MSSGNRTQDVGPELHEVVFQGEILRRGFWLYVWELMPRDGRSLYYIGRTGDSSSTNAQSPFNRMAQHLGFASNSCMLRRHLGMHGVRPEECSFRLVALGPLEAESTATTRDEHDQRRNLIAAMEKALADTFAACGCLVMNRVGCRMPLDARRFKQVRHEFARAFPHLPLAVTAAGSGG